MLREKGTFESIHCTKAPYITNVTFFFVKCHGDILAIAGRGAQHDIWENREYER
jgi:hypothetical protein